MDWLGVVALAVALLISRRVIYGRWRRYQIGHRTAAALWASTVPIVLVVLWTVRGVDGADDLLLLGGLVALTFIPTFLMALWFLRAIAGEMDPPSSSGYRRRP